MTKHLLAATALAIALGLNASPMMAQKGHGNPHGGNPHEAAAEGEHGNPHGYKDADENWERRGKYEYHTYAPGSVPPGWSHGKKTGWGNCGMPPGQAKKYGCNTYTYQGRPYYYYQDTGGQIIVRRPIIEIHGSVDIVR